MTAKIVVHEFISADGVFENPGWTFEFGFTPQMEASMGALTGAAETILLGRNTHAMFAPGWRDRTVEDDPGAPFFNETEKLVVGANELTEEWNNTTPIGAFDPARIRQIKQEREGSIFTSGSGQLVRGLLAEGLVDELHLFVYPISLGEGERFWGDLGVKLRLLDSETFDNGVVHLTYGPASDA